jgi:acetoin utilization deacetylase AcuC-like enzyme
MPLPIVHHPDYDARFPAHHRFPMGKYGRLMEWLEGRGILARGELHVPSPAPFEWLSRAHHPLYVEQVVAAEVPLAVERAIGFPVDRAVSRRARLAAAGTVLAARLALRHGVACNTAGGSHHARRDGGAGFCTFNDVAVAAHALLAEGEAERILVVDLDVHQGDGTADIFAGDPRVFTLSVHAEKNYPARKIASDLDIGLGDRLADAAYLARLSEVLPFAAARARPDIVFYNAGVDPHEEDRLGRLSLTDAGLRRRERMVFEFFRARGIPVCGVIGGGYSLDIDALAGRHALLFEVAAEFA